MWFLLLAPIFAARSAVRMLGRTRTTCDRPQSAARPEMQTLSALTALAAVASIITMLNIPDGWWSLILLFGGWIILPILSIVFYAMSHSAKPQKLPREKPTAPLGGRIVNFTLNTIAIIGLTVGSAAAVCALGTGIGALKGVVEWKWFFLFAAIVATMPASGWLYDRTKLSQEEKIDPAPHLIEPSPKLPPDDGPLNPRMYWSDRR